MSREIKDWEFLLITRASLPATSKMFPDNFAGVFQ